MLSFGRNQMTFSLSATLAMNLDDPRKSLKMKTENGHWKGVIRNGKAPSKKLPTIEKKICLTKTQCLFIDENFYPFVRIHISVFLFLRSSAIFGLRIGSEIHSACLKIMSIYAQNPINHFFCLSTFGLTEYSPNFFFPEVFIWFRISLVIERNSSNSVQ